jgi:hypothetical protein
MLQLAQQLVLLLLFVCFNTYTTHACCTYALSDHRFLERDIVVADRVFNIDSITTASMGQFAVLNTEQVPPPMHAAQ